MKRWDKRPFEVRNLFNPAFCGLVLFRSFQAYEEEAPKGMHFSLSLLVLPLCLHKGTREVILNSPRSYLLKTIEKNQHILVGFAERVTQMIPYTFEGFGLLMERGGIVFSEVGRIQTIEKKVRKSITGTDETVACQKTARIMGKEFARIADRATIYTTFGIRP
jgi:hypothetical protein